MDSQPTNQVSWQSAFWGLVPIAFSSMSQPSGKILDGPSGIGFMLRISPIICFFDVLVVLLRYAKHIFTTGSVSEARNRVIVQRFTADDEVVGPLRDLRENVVFRGMAFLISFSQIVKLYGMQGIFWTQVCASMFLGSFLVLEVLVIWLSYTVPKSMFQRPELIQATSAIVLPYSAVTISACSTLYVLVHAVMSITSLHGRPLNIFQCIAPTIFICGAIAFVPSALYRWWKGAPEARAQNRQTEAAPRRDGVLNTQNFLLLSILAVPVAYLSFAYIPLSVQANDHSFGSTTTNILTSTMIAIWAPLCFLWAWKAFKDVLALGRPSASLVERCLSWYFCALNFIAALLYYSFVYDPQGTVKPAWTEQLG